jgi:hypothetical protein
MPSDRAGLLNITVLVTISKDPRSLPPEEMIRYYESQEVKFNFVPLGLKGRARSISHLCPDIESDNPEDMGAYYPFHQRNKDNEEKSNLILIQNDYFLYQNDPIIEFANRWKKIARLGHITE